jgi:hypothetical protein
MPVDWSNELYAKCWDSFARPITVTPTVSQPGAPAYAARAYFDTKETDILTEANSVLSDSQTFIDIRRVEFSIEPKQGDLIDIPYAADVEGGTYEVMDLAGKGNAGGIITISLRAIETPLP